MLFSIPNARSIALIIDSVKPIAHAPASIHKMAIRAIMQSTTSGSFSLFIILEVDGGQVKCEFGIISNVREYVFNHLANPLVITMFFFEELDNLFLLFVVHIEPSNNPFYFFETFLFRMFKTANSIFE